jgi:hypothetical protein
MNPTDMARQTGGQEIESFFMHCLLIKGLKISHRCNFVNLNTFDLMIALAAKDYLDFRSPEKFL